MHSMHLKGGDIMRYAILGGDMRFAHLVQMLRESGRDSAGFLQEAAGEEMADLQEISKYSCIISNWPMKWPLAKAEVTQEEIMENIAPGSVLLLCGPQFPKQRRWDLQYINLWDDEILLQENAWLTAEGAVASAIQKMHGSLTGACCMVIGYGRIGRALTEILLNLGARVTVASGKETKRLQAQESGAEVVDSGEMAIALPDQKLIFSTPPAMVLDQTVLEQVHPDALLIDLASPPYGIDLEAAHRLGLKAVREPGLPGRYCPLSAARVLYNAVLRWEEGEFHEK